MSVVSSAYLPRVLVSTSVVIHWLLRESLNMVVVVNRSETFPFRSVVVDWY